LFLDITFICFFNKKGNGWKVGEKGKSFLENEMWSVWRQQNGETDGRRQYRDHVSALPFLPDSRLFFPEHSQDPAYSTRVTYRMFLLSAKRSIHQNVTLIYLHCLLILADNWNVVRLFPTTDLGENITYTHWFYCSHDCLSDRQVLRR
jgi:hypothetical protein